MLQKKVLCTSLGSWEASEAERENVAKKGTLNQSREASEVYLTIQTVRKLGKTKVSRSQLIKCIPEKDSMGL